MAIQSVQDVSKIMSAKNFIAYKRLRFPNFVLGVENSDKKKYKDLDQILNGKLITNEI